jgi:hypothetical protein
VSLISKSLATWITGFSRFSARAAAPALTAFVHTRRFFPALPIFFFPCVVLLAYLFVYQMG